MINISVVAGPVELHAHTSNVTAREERPSSFGGECYPAREFYFEKKNDVLCEKKKAREI